MNNSEYENKHNGTSKKLKAFGVLLLIVGLGCTIAGITDFFIHLSSHGMPTLFFLCFIGFPCAAAGGVCLVLGYQRKMNSYIASQNAPVAKDAMNYMLDGTSDAIAKAAGKVANSIDNSSKVEGVNFNTCSKCGHKNPAGTKFCSKCGAIIVKKCPYCGAQNDDSAQYCNSCGKNIQ